MFLFFVAETYISLQGSELARLNSRDHAIQVRFHVWQNSKWLKAIHEARIPEGLHLYYADFRFRRFCLERLIGLDIFATNRLFQTDSVHSLSYPVGHDKDALRAFDRCWLLE